MIYATNTKEILFFFAPDNSHYENRWGNVKMSEEYDQFSTVWTLRSQSMLQACKSLTLKCYYVPPEDGSLRSFYIKNLPHYEESNIYIIHV